MVRVLRQLLLIEPHLGFISFELPSKNLELELLLIDDEVEDLVIHEQERSHLVQLSLETLDRELIVVGPNATVDLHQLIEDYFET